MSSNLFMIGNLKAGFKTQLTNFRKKQHITRCVRNRKYNHALIWFLSYLFNGNCIDGCILLKQNVLLFILTRYAKPHIRAHSGILNQIFKVTFMPAGCDLDLLKVIYVIWPCDLELTSVLEAVVFGPGRSATMWYK